MCCTKLSCLLTGRGPEVLADDDLVLLFGVHFLVDDKMLLSREVSELVRLEKQEAELLRQQRQDEIEKSVRNQLLQHRQGHMQVSFNPGAPHGGYNPATDLRRPARATGSGGPQSGEEDQPTIRSSDEIDWTDLKAASEAHRKERRAKYGV